VVRGKTTPLHIHENEDETLYVLEGEILVHIDGPNIALGRAVSHSCPGRPPCVLCHLGVRSSPHSGNACERRGVLPGS
jgi:mannose-6-phosphate isomerase-like protein (cupin superfamily)